MLFSNQPLDDNTVREYLSTLQNLQLKHLKSKNYNIWDYVNNRYNDSDSFGESLYRIINNINERPVCKICGNKVKYQGLIIGFKHTCSKECEKIYRHNIGVECSVINRPDVREKIKQTCLEKYGSCTPFGNAEIKEKIKNINLKKYGVISPFGSKEIQEKSKTTKIEKYGNVNYNNTEKCKHTKLEKYGDENYNNTEKRIKTCQEKYGGNAPICASEIYDKIKNTNIIKYGFPYLCQNVELKNKARQTNIAKYGVPYGCNPEKRRETVMKKYGVPYAWNNEKQKETMIKKYGVPYAMQSNELKRKQHLSAKNNGHCCTSKFEEYAYQQLIDKFGTEDIIRQYNSYLYPFNCDFYIKSLDIYIEIQGSQFHHFHPFNENDINDIIELNKLKQKTGPQYKAMIDVWTVKDPNKRNIAKEHNLNFYEFYNKNEFDVWINELQQS